MKSLPALNSRKVVRALKKAGFIEDAKLSTEEFLKLL